MTAYKKGPTGGRIPVTGVKNNGGVQPIISSTYFQSGGSGGLSYSTGLNGGWAVRDPDRDGDVDAPNQPDKDGK